MTRSPFMLNAEWFDEDIKQYLAPNLIAEGAKDLKVTDDRVRLALAHAALREGKKVGRWEVAVEIAAAAAGLDRETLLKRAKSGKIETRARATTAEFNALQVTQRPTFLLENAIGDRAVFSGLAKVEPIAAAMDAMLADEAAQASYGAHHGNSPPPAA
jgi:predicted DsbA family dithiol-disulfide isomerase